MRVLTRRLLAQNDRIDGKQLKPATLVTGATLQARALQGLGM